MHSVLLIDDEPWSREVVKALGQWDRLGFKLVGEAEDGNSGVAMIEKLRPDVVITDMRMPGLDGVGLLKAINESFPELKIIVISGYDDFVYLRQAVASRATDYLLKPIDPDELNAALAKCAAELDKHKAETPFAGVEYTVFEEPELRELYLNLRRRLSAALLELDEEAVLELVGKFDDSVLAKMGQDLMLIVETFAAENDIQLKAVWNRGGRSFDGSGDSLRFIYGEVMKDAIAFRRNRNRLDLDDVVRFIERHYSDPISLDTVAHYFHVTKEHLSRTFKAHTGRNMTDAIVALRMDKAREAIESGLPIRQAAELVGYADIAYFYRVFKKQFGAAPGEWIKQKEARQYRAIEEDNIVE
ncbi:response regulator [Cohnella panacarvi]|uniref:response regulator n=1 Tax=Cohnella panacarvi TaxID=400776 RepID=UPI00047B815C|nr:response regulator [Cohnella panacarvi]